MVIMRRAPFLARFVLAWFALSLGVAIASPMVQPKAMDWVCVSSGGMKWVAVGDDGDASTSSVSHTLDCPLCAHFSAPLPQARLTLKPLSPPAQTLQLAITTPVVMAAAPPLPSRGPPASFL